jgi:hypothetical protein
VVWHPSIQKDGEELCRSNLSWSDTIIAVGCRSETYWAISVAILCCGDPLLQARNFVRAGQLVCFARDRFVQANSRAGVRRMLAQVLIPEADPFVPLSLCGLSRACAK